MIRFAAGATTVTSYTLDNRHAWAMCDRMMSKPSFARFSLAKSSKALVILARSVAASAPSYSTTSTMSA